MRNIALILTYVGTAYHGWQVQPKDITVEETLEKACAKVVGHRVHMTGCGRTDAGVHAKRYVANFRTESTIPVDRLPYALNTHLPGDIVVTEAREMPESFNAIGSCVKKEYTYLIYNAVRSVGTDVRSTVRTVYYYEVERTGDILSLRVCANGFLYNMARAMAGTLVWAAEGKIRPEELGAILRAGDRTAAGPTVPAGGLYMTRLWYETPEVSFHVE